MNNPTDPQGAIKFLTSTLEVVGSSIYEPVKLSPKGTLLAHQALQTLEEALSELSTLQAKVSELTITEQANLKEIKRLYREEIEPLRQQVASLLAQSNEPT